MVRKEFLKSCGYACLSGTTFITLLQSCTNTKILSATIQDSDLIVPLSEFEIKTGTTTNYKKYIVVHNYKLKYPICVFRFADHDFSALWMRCTHQGTELQVFGDKLQCPAHGSEFDQQGKVQNSPAETPLRNFPVSIEGNQLKISLKAV